MLTSVLTAITSFQKVFGGKNDVSLVAVIEVVRIQFVGAFVFWHRRWYWILLA
jgi:hypothetical protein